MKSTIVAPEPWLQWEFPLIAENRETAAGWVGAMLASMLASNAHLSLVDQQGEEVTASLIERRFEKSISIGIHGEGHVFHVNYSPQVTDVWACERRVTAVYAGGRLGQTKSLLVEGQRTVNTGRAHFWARHGPRDPHDRVKGFYLVLSNSEDQTKGVYAKTPSCAMDLEVGLFEVAKSVGCDTAAIYRYETGR